MLRFGLCCQFHEQPIKFRQATAAVLGRLERRQQMVRLAELCRHNAQTLLAALGYCAAHGIGSFRVMSQILPLRTHPEVGYTLESLPGGAEIVERFLACGTLARERGLRLSFHPDQFIVLSSPREDVLANSLREIEYQAEVAELVGADVINVHGGGAYGDKTAALDRFRRALERLSPRARERLTVENDDRVYRPAELWALCQSEGLPLVYDVHHHRCLPDDWSVEEATARALSTWKREPLFHVSSPRDGWGRPPCHYHHDYIDVADFPADWCRLDLTVEVEAKAKEAAIFRLQADLARVGCLAARQRA